MTRRKHCSYLHQGFETLYPFLTLLLLETRQSASQSARYLGVTLDVHLTMTAHVVKLIRIANFVLRHINSIRHYLSVQATKTLFSAFVLSRLDYCISLLSCCLQYLLNRLQAVHLILKTPKTEHITPHLHTLHWLPIDSRIKYKLCSLCFGAITSTGPIFPIYSRFTHPLGNSDPLQTSINCSFHLSTLSHTVNALSLTLLQHSGTHFQKRSIFSSFFFFRSALKTHLFPT